MDSIQRVLRIVQRLALMLAWAGIVTLPAMAQSPAAPDAQTLAKYDKNNNGKARIPKSQRAWKAR